MPEAAAAAAAAAAPLPAAVADAAAADCCSLRPVHKEKKHRPPDKKVKRVCTQQALLRDRPNIIGQAVATQIRNT